jgi:hypothetical protein
MKYKNGVLCLPFVVANLPNRRSSFHSRASTQQSPIHKPRGPHRYAHLIDMFYNFCSLPFYLLGVRGLNFSLKYLMASLRGGKVEVPEYVAFIYFIYSFFIPFSSVFRFMLRFTLHTILTFVPQFDFYCTCLFSLPSSLSLFRVCPLFFTLPLSFISLTFLLSRTPFLMLIFSLAFSPCFCFVFLMLSFCSLSLLCLSNPPLQIHTQRTISRIVCESSSFLPLLVPLPYSFPISCA